MSQCRAIFYSATHNLQEMTKKHWQFCDYGVDSYIPPFDSKHIRPFQVYFGRTALFAPESLQKSHILSSYKYGAPITVFCI